MFLNSAKAFGYCFVSIFFFGFHSKRSSSFYIKNDTFGSGSFDVKLEPFAVFKPLIIIRFHCSDCFVMDIDKGKGDLYW